MDKAVAKANFTRRNNEARYKAMCRAKTDEHARANLSIHRKQVWGQGYPYHAHVTSLRD